MNRKFELGVIEGFYGAPWNWETRQEFIRFLKRAGYAFYFYAPKADGFFRRKWREAVPPEHVQDLKSLAGVSKDEGIAFGIGFSPYEIYVAFDDEAKERLLARLELFNEIGVERLAILFDDMKNAPGLARTQAHILHWVKERSRCSRLLMCPTYYSLDPTLDRIFGQRPADYLTELGKCLDPDIDVFWTGEEIVSQGYTLEHIRWVNAQLGRKVCLWDNYPVNDGPKMCKFLHVNAVTRRPHTLAGELAAHFVNPMNQAWLSRVPLLTLKASYDLKAAYSPEKAFMEAATTVAGPALAGRLWKDLDKLQQLGLDALTPEAKQELIAAYGQFRHPLAEEIVEWLEGKYSVTRDVFFA